MSERHDATRRAIDAVWRIEQANRLAGGSLAVGQALLLP